MVAYVLSVLGFQPRGWRDIGRDGERQVGQRWASPSHISALGSEQLVVLPGKKAMLSFLRAQQRHKRAKGLELWHKREDS